MGRCRNAVHLLVFVLPILLAVAPLARAENLGPGGGTRIIVGDQAVGPYRLLFTVAPEPAQVGRVTFVVRLSDPGSDTRIRDAEVTLDLTHGETGTALTRTLTHVDAGNPIDYAGHIQIEQAGQWAGTLHVRAAAGSIDVAFLQRVLPQRQLSTLIIVGIPFLVILGVLGGLWFVRSGSRAKGRAAGSL